MIRTLYVLPTAAFGVVPCAARVGDPLAGIATGPSMSFAAAVFTCLRKCIDVRGRASRREFWSFLVFWIAVAVASALVLEIPHGPITTGAALKALASAPVLLIPLGLLVPLAAVAVRRLHDIGLSGWWLVSAAAPVPVLDVFIVGAQVVCFAKAGTPGANRYGPDPKTR